MNRAGSTQTFVNSIRIPDRERKVLLTEIEARVLRYSGSERRAAPRVSCHDLHEVVSRVAHPGGSETMCVFHPRNIARRGAAFVVGTYLHPGTQCSLLFHALDGRQVITRATIMHCRHIRGRIHEAGATFDKDFNLQDVGLAEPAPAPAATQDGGGAGPPEIPSVPNGAAAPASLPVIADLALKLRQLLDAEAPLAEMRGVVDRLQALCRAPSAAPPEDPAATSPQDPDAPAPASATTPEANA